MENFGWDIKTLEQRNLMRIYRIHIDPRQPNVEEQVDIDGSQVLV